jgi:hypothetical protein
VAVGDVATHDWRKANPTIFGTLTEGVTLRMGQLQTIEVHGAAEKSLPLVDLDGVRSADALEAP